MTSTNSASANVTSVEISEVAYAAIGRLTDGIAATNHSFALEAAKLALSYEEPLQDAEP